MLQHTMRRAAAGSQCKQQHVCASAHHAAGKPVTAYMFDHQHPEKGKQPNESCRLCFASVAAASD